MTPKFNNIKSISIGLGILTILIILKFTFSWTDEFLTAIISGVAFIGFIVSLQLQRNSIDIQHQELKNSIEEIRNQTEEFKKQNEEHKFKRVVDITYKQIELTIGEQTKDNPTDRHYKLFNLLPQLKNDIDSVSVNLTNPNSPNRLSEFNRSLEKFVNLFSIVKTSIIIINNEQKKFELGFDLLELYLVNIDSNLLNSIFRIQKKFIEDENINEKINERPELQTFKNVIEIVKILYPNIEKYRNTIPSLSNFKEKSQ